MLVKRRAWKGPTAYADRFYPWSAPRRGFRGLGDSAGPVPVTAYWDYIGPASPIGNAAIWFRSLFQTAPTKIGTAPAPTGDDLTLPPASGEDAAALQQALADEAMRRQQAIAAGQVQSSIWDEAASEIVDAGNAISSGPLGVSWWVWLAGLGAFAFVAISAGTPRRYGR